MKNNPFMNLKVLIVCPSWIGDMVMMQPLCRLLKQRHSSVIIDVLTPAWTQPLIACMPEVNESIPMPFCHGEFGLLKRYRLGQALRAKGYQQAIVLPNSFKSALIPFFAKIPKRIGWRGEMRYGLLNDMRVLNKEKYPLMIERFMALALPKGAEIPTPYPVPHFSVNREAARVVLEKFHLNADGKKIMVLCPGAQFGASKRWPTEYYAEVANRYLDRGWLVWLLGSASDKVFADDIQIKSGNRCCHLAGGTNLSEVIHLLSLAHMVVTNDSGLMHIAAALNIPLVAIYGSSSPAFTPPLGERIKVLWLHLECSPCFQRECPLKHWRCMLELKPERVLQAINELLSP